MRMLRYVDYDCPECLAEHTRFVYFDTETGKPDDEEQHCDAPIVNDEDVCELPCGTTCGGVLTPREMSNEAGHGYGGGIAKGNHDYNERQRQRLERRADDHWRRQGRDEAIDRERAQLKKHGAVGGVK